MKSLHLRSRFMIAVASTLIASMLLGSVLISNAYAKTTDSEQSQYNLDVDCLDDHKGEQITLTGNRNVETTDTDLEQDTNTKSESESDFDATVDEDAFEDGNITGELGFLNPLFEVGTGELNVFAPLATKLGDDHFEVGDKFVQRNDDGSVTITPLNDNTESKDKSDLNQDRDERIKDSLKFKKSFPLKERREFNVCDLPIGNIVDGFQFNEIEGTKKSDILLGTSAADDLSGKGSGDVIQGRDEDDIVHGGSGPDSIQGGFGNDNIHGDDGDDAIFAGPNDDYLNGGDGNDELYAQDGDDTLEGGPGANFFDCGSGFDTVVDFNPNKGDVTNDNCEDVRTVL
jgi:Ca2+-binding RTX toxin-like protein